MSYFSKMGRKFYPVLFGATILLTGCSQQTIEGSILQMILKSEYDLNGNVIFISTCKTDNFECLARQAAAVCLSKGVGLLAFKDNPPVFSCSTKK